MPTYTSDTITGMFLLAAILQALDDYAQRLARIEYRVGLVARQHGLSEVLSAEPPRGRGRPRGSLNKPKTPWVDGHAAAL
jgi:hypothetical protein